MRRLTWAELVAYSLFFPAAALGDVTFLCLETKKSNQKKIQGAAAKPKILEFKAKTRNSPPKKGTQTSGFLNALNSKIS